MIKKIGKNYVVLSDDGSRRLGTYKTLGDARERLQQVEIFKRLSKKK